MKCDICHEEFANSEELKAHKERDHTPDERADEELESPDMMAEEPESAPVQGQN